MATWNQQAAVRGRNLTTCNERTPSRQKSGDADRVSMATLENRLHQQPLRWGECPRCGSDIPLRRADLYWMHSDSEEFVDTARLDCPAENCYWSQYLPHERIQRRVAAADLPEVEVSQ
jgi:hypothetical protein